MQQETDLKQRFEACIDASAESMFRVAYRLTGNDTLARELVQETYLNAWKSLPTLADQSKLRSWMFAILRNQYSKLIRVESKIAKQSDQLDSIPERKSTPNRTNDLINQAIQELDEKFRLPLLLVAMEQMSVDEAAATLELPRGTVLSRLHRGRQKLKEFLIRADSQLADRNQESQIDGK